MLLNKKNKFVLRITPSSLSRDGKIKMKKPKPSMMTYTCLRRYRVSHVTVITTIVISGCYYGDQTSTSAFFEHFQ